ncbi:MAG: beta-ketoacyl-ACP synthase I, partial [Rhodocyclaceae bacterium]|nr:beta-ketoacyl-ACP synthase I [Rhodocyclaceae bacterium]
MQRVCVTGLGIVSCLGNDAAAVSRALAEGRPGISYRADFAERGLSSRVAGVPDLSAAAPIPRKLRRYMADAAVYAYHAMAAAILDAGLDEAQLRDARCGLIVGSGVGSTLMLQDAYETLRTRGMEKLPPYYVPQVMGSTASACLAQAWNIGGPSYTLSAACASSAHSLGCAADLIRHGVLERAIAGGAEEVAWTSACLFDAMGALSTHWNDTPATASRPFDRARDGFVIAGGAGMLVLESESAARRRGAHIYAELSGYGASSGGADMVQPDPAAVAQAMQAALQQAGRPRVDYLNPHATSTPLGDSVELDAIRRVFGAELPAISSTKGLTGHAIGAAGVHEAIFCLLMLEREFMAASANLFEPDPATAGLPILRDVRPGRFDCAMSTS